MKPLSPALAAHLAGEVLTVCTLWRVARTDGRTLAFTDHDVDVTYGGLTYQAATGYTRSAIRSSSGLAVDQLDLEGLLDSDDITVHDLMAGRYDHALIDVFLVNWADLGMGHLHLRRGWLGEVTIKHGLYVAELRGLAQALSRRVVELISASCRADLGDSRCQVDLEALTVTGAVTAAGGSTNFTDSSRGEDSYYFTHGVITWTSGQNAGLTGEIKSSDPPEFLLWLPMPFPIQIGDTYRLSPGCDKTKQTCIEKFNNIINMRAEPFVTTSDLIFRSPDARIE